MKNFNSSPNASSQIIEEARNEDDSIGGVVTCVCRGAQVYSPFCFISPSFLSFLFFFLFFLFFLFTFTYYDIIAWVGRALF